MRNIIIAIRIIIILSLFSPVYAVDPHTPPGEPDSDAFRQYTIQDLYNLITKRKLAEKQIGPFTGPFESIPKSENPSLNELYEALRTRVGIMQPSGELFGNTEGMGIPWPRPRFTIIFYGCDDDDSNCDEKNDVVRDNLTKFEWVRTPAIVTLGKAWTPTGKRLETYRQKILTYNSSSYRAGGYSDWRAPSLREAMTLIDPSKGVEENKEEWAFRKKPFRCNTFGDGQAEDGDPFIVLKNFKDRYGTYCTYDNPEDSECQGLAWKPAGKWLIISDSYWSWPTFKFRECTLNCPVCSITEFCPEGIKLGDPNPLCEQALAVSFESGTVTSITMNCIGHYVLMLVRR